MTLTCASLQFFEAGLEGPTGEERAYVTRFPKGTTRCVWFTVTCHNANRQADRTYRIGYRYYFPNGQLMAEYHKDWLIKARWGECWWSYACGYEEPGQWEEGSYLVVILLEGAVFASGSFTIA